MNRDSFWYDLLKEFNVVNNSGVGIMLSFLSSIFIFTLIISFVFYFLNNYPLYRMAKNAGHKYAWFAWIPILNFYLICMLPKKKFSLFQGSIKLEKRVNSYYIYLGLTLIPSIVPIVSMLPFVGIIVEILSFFATIPLYFILYVWYRDLYEAFREGNDPNVNIILAIVSIFVPLVKTIVLWISYKNAPYYGAGMYDLVDEYDPNAY